MSRVDNTKKQSLLARLRRQIRKVGQDPAKHSQRQTDHRPKREQTRQRYERRP